MNEDSPYLQQHAHNPVEWYPWGKEALEKAKKEKKLIFLSIGYSTCHWCHVMEEESFEDKDVAKILNRDFVAIKVDKETHPQIDKKYQKYYMRIFGKRGGWPLSVFLTPEGKVFHLATYIPKERGYGSQGIMTMLPNFVKAYQSNSKVFKRWIVKYGEKKKQTMNALPIGMFSLGSMIEGILEQYDKKNGGFAKRPKFPEASKIHLLLDIYRLNGDVRAKNIASHVLSAMAKNGIYDHVEGGFFRYTTDERWRIPHFEKMLYTNAELISVYSEAYLNDKNVRYKNVINETIHNMDTYYMKEGLYFSASDADSEGEEGRYFIYSYEKIYDALRQKQIPKKEIEKVLRYFGIEEDGNIDSEFSHIHITQKIKPKYYDETLKYLKVLRGKRVFPFIDKKIITSWNAMMIKALFDASIVEKKYLVVAEKRLKKLYGLMRRDEILYHQTLFGKKPRQEALLEDYAFLIDTLLAAHQRTLKESYLAEAKSLSDEAVKKFYKTNIWYLSDDNVKAKADFDDRHYTSPLSVMLDNLLRISYLTEQPKYKKIVDKTVKTSNLKFKKIPTDNPRLANLFLRLKYGYVMIHATKEKLEQASETLSAMKYPFVLKGATSNNTYLACSTNSCFAEDGNISRLIKKLEKVLYVKGK